MLTNLTIQNYVLIKNLELRPSGNLNIITGETGAGKSILLGAVGLLLGARADTRALLREEQKCVIEGTFDISDYQLQGLFEEEDLDYGASAIFRREISPSGKSRAFINDTPVRLETMRAIGARLVDVHSQHETLLLGDSGFQLMVVDAFAQNQSLLSDYQKQYTRFKEAEKAYQSIVSEGEALKKEYEFNKFQYDEIAALALRAGEQEELEEEQNMLENTEEYKTCLARAEDLLSENEFSVLNSLGEVKGDVGRLAGLSQKYAEMLERLDSVLIELREMSRDIGHGQEQLEFNPERAEEVQGRLDSIYRLQKKHQVGDIAGLLALQEDLERKIGLVVNMEEGTEKARLELETSRQEMTAAAEALSGSRRSVFETITRETERLLEALSLPDAQLAVRHTPCAPRENGCDDITFMFSANKGVAPEELRKVASGGEMSRLMFCIKYQLAGKTALPTIIFDEIDTGVSGEIAMKLGKMMRAMGARHQVFAITHLPQIASRGDEHYYVYKNNQAETTASEIRRLEGEERTSEIAQMIAGDSPSEAAIESARELLDS